MESEKLIECKNCNKMINEQKFDLHEAYCLRNIVKCPKCNEPLNKNDKEQHEKEFHSLVPCQYCKVKFEKSQLENHLINCEFKPINCQFCKLPITKTDILKHETQCGSRTEICKFCKQRIQLSQFEDHEIQCEINQALKKEDQTYDKQFPVLADQKIQQKKKQSKISHKFQQEEQKKSIGTSPKRHFIEQGVSQIPQMSSIQQKQQVINKKEEVPYKKTLYEELLEQQFKQGLNFGTSSQDFAEKFNDQQLDAILNKGQFESAHQPVQPAGQFFDLQQDNYSNPYDALYNLNPQNEFGTQEQQIHHSNSFEEPELSEPEPLHKEPSGLDADVTMQKAIQESLNDQWKYPKPDLNATMNSEDFKKAIELSKQFK